MTHISTMRVVLRVTVVFIMIESAKAADLCDSGWFYWYNEHEGSGKCYFVSSSATTFNDSARRCQWAGAQLASLATEDENDFIRSLFEEGKVAYTVKEYWLGMYREDISSYNLTRGWVWFDGTDFTWANWGPGEPNEDERCARLRTSGSYKWFGRECSANFGRICEKLSRTMATSSSIVRTKTEASDISSSTPTHLPTTSISTSTSTKQCGCCECDCPENKTKGNSVLIAVGVVGWCLNIVVITVAAVIFYILKRRLKSLTHELRSHKYAKGTEPDYEQVGLRPVIGTRGESNRSGTKVTAGSGGLGHDLPRHSTDDSWSRNVAAEYENQPDTSAIQYENTRLASRIDPTPKDDEQDMNTIKYGSLQGNNRSTTPNPTYTSLGLPSNAE